MPPDTPTQPPDDSEPSASESGGRIEQSELDELIAAFEEGETRAPESSDQSKVESSEPSDAPGGSDETEEAEASPDSSAPEVEGSTTGGGLIAQSELDALIAAFEDKERRAREGDQPPAASAPSSPASEPVSTEPPGESFESTSTGPASESDIEALIQQATQVADEEAEVDEDTSEELDALTESETEWADAAPVSADVDATETEKPSTELDDAFEELMSAAETGEVSEPERQEWPKPPPKPEEPEEDSELVKAAAGGAEDDTTELSDLESPEAAIGGEMDDALTDTPEPDDVLVETAAAADSPEELSQSQLDELLAAAEVSDPEAVESGAEGDSVDAEPVAAKVSEPAPAAETAEAALEATTVASDVMEEVGSENVAAGAVDDVPQPTNAESRPDASGPQGTKESDKEAPKPAPKPDRPSWLPPSPVELFREEPWRASAALAAGLLVALSTIVVLLLNQFRMPDPEQLAFSAPGALNRAALLADELMEDNRPEEALALLDRALASADAFDEGYDDARFARIEAMLASLPATLSPNRAAQVHAAIDDAVETARAHPRAAEALLWKGQVYEREGNLIAARAEYRGILDNFATSDVRDDVLLALATVELATDRPLLAIDSLQEIISNHPNSPHRGRARLLLGDAYAAAGDSDLARGTYIRLAEEQMDGEVGGEAFERLGNLALDEGDIRGAIRELESRLESATTVEGHDRVNLTLARAYRGIGDYEKARNVLNGLIDFFPESDVMPLALAELSQVLADLGQETEAVRLATRAAERFPESPEVLRNAGDLLMRADEPGAAAGYILAAYEAGAREPNMLLAAADQYRAAGALDDAQEAYDRLIVAFPTTPQAIEATVGWAEAAQAKGEVSDAYERLQKLARATEGRPRQLPVLRALGRLYRDLGLESDAVQAFTQVTAITDDPEALAEASIELMRAGAIDDGLAVAERVDTAKLSDESAYAFLTTQGDMVLRVRPSRAVDLLVEAHETYPDERTAAGVTKLLDALLTLGRSAQARAVITDMDARVQQPEYAHERPLLNRSAAAYGDFLYARGDYRAAVQAYATALGARPGQEPPAIVSVAGLSEVQLWSLYQRANAFAALEQHEKSLELYDQLAAAASPLAKDAEARAAAVRVERRMRGETAAESDQRAT